MTMKNLKKNTGTPGANTPGAAASDANAPGAMEAAGKAEAKGALIAITAAIFWGFSGTCSQYIFENFPVDASHLTSVRMLIAGLILTAAGWLTGRPEMRTIWKTKRDVGHLLIFSVFGIMLCQLSYMKAIQWTNSGTATILQYTGPVMVMAVTCFLEKRMPHRKEILAIILAVLGTFLLATHGNIHTMVLTPQGLTWGILAAVTLAAYTLLPQRLIRDFGSIAVTGYGMVLGGIVLSLLTRVWTMDFTPDYRFFLAFGAIVILGTALSFSMYLKGVAMIGPVKASLIASIEPVSATVFMILWLNVPFYPMDLAGFLCIFCTVFLLLKKEMP